MPDLTDRGCYPPRYVPREQRASVFTQCRREILSLLEGLLGASRSQDVFQSESHACPEMDVAEPTAAHRTESTAASLSENLLLGRKA